MASLIHDKKLGHTWVKLWRNGNKHRRWVCKYCSITADSPSNVNNSCPQVIAIQVARKLRGDKHGNS